MWSAGDIAVFGGSAGTVSVTTGATAVSASSITFSTTGYVVQDSGGGSPSLAPAPISIGGGLSETISSVLNGSGALAVSGGGTLVLSGTNTSYFTGATEINSGTLKLNSSAALGSSSGVSAAAGGTLDLNGKSIGSGVNLENFGGTLTNSSGTAVSFAGTINATTGASS